MRAFLYALPVALALGIGSVGTASASDDEVNNPKTTRVQSAAPVVTNAKRVASAQDHQRVELHGRIVGVIDKQEGTEYVLSDNTGSVVANISDEALHGETLFIGTAVELQGEVNSASAIEPKVEARQVQILASVSGPPIRDQEIYSD
jgi:uncharacterized protein YdeI (BOF family)